MYLAKKMWVKSLKNENFQVQAGASEWAAVQMIFPQVDNDSGAPIRSEMR